MSTANDREALRKEAQDYLNDIKGSVFCDIPDGSGLAEHVLRFLDAESDEISQLRTENSMLRSPATVDISAAQEVESARTEMHAARRALRETNVEAAGLRDALRETIDGWTHALDCWERGVDDLGIREHARRRIAELRRMAGG